MSLLPFAARDVLRNRRRTISSIVGVLLAVTFVAGTFIAIDSSARATLDASLAGIPGDFSFQMNVRDPSTVNYSTIEEPILETAGIVDVSLYRQLPIGEYTGAGTPFGNRTDYGETLAINPDRLPSMIRDLEVTGSLALPRGSVGLGRDLASSLNVGIGDTIKAVYRYNETALWETNLTVAGILETGRLPSGNLVPYPGPIFSFRLAVIHLRDADWLLTELGQPTGSGTTVTGEIWIDRATYVFPYDVDATARSLERLQRRLQGILGPDVYYVQNNIMSRIVDFSNRVAAQRIQYSLLSLPVVLLGVYLGVVGVDMSHAERRRELAVLKTRGARRGQLIGLLILEAVVGGLIAAVIGLAVGVLLSRFLLDVVTVGSGPRPQYESVVLTTDTILAISFESMVLMFLVAYRSAKRTASLPIVETLRFYAPGETKIHYSPRVDIALVSIGLADYVLVAWRQGASTNLWTFLLGIVPFLLLPFVPLMLIIGLARLLTRSTGKVYDWFSRAAKPFVGDLYHVIRRNLVRNPRRSSNVAIIIALGLAFGTFTLSTLATQDAHAIREIRAYVGADIVAIPTTTSDLTANLTAIPGVVAVAQAVTFHNVRPVYCCGTVWGMDPDSYFAVAQPESWYFSDGSAANAQNSLATPGQALVSQAYYDNAFVAVGDRLRLEADLYDQNGTFGGTVQVNVTIAGVVRSLPGMDFGSYSPAIFGSLDTLAPFQSPSSSPFPGTSVRYLIDIGAGADWRSVKEAVLQEPGVAYVDVAEERIESIGANPFVRALYQFISMELVFIGVILTAGVGLILYAASLERDVEFAAIIARGSSGWQTAKLLVGEAFVILLVGLVIGVAVGVGSAFFATQFFAVGPPGTPPPAVPFFFVFPLNAVFLVVLAPSAILLSAVLVSARIARMNVAKVLKLRGG